MKKITVYGLNYISVYLKVTCITFILLLNQILSTYAQELKNKKTEKEISRPDSGFITQFLNNRLNPYGIKLGMNWTTETTGVVRGGKRKGADYTHAIVVTLDMDWQKLIGLSGFSTHASFLNLSGRSTSNDYIGDTIIQSQETYIPHQAMIRMYYFYAEQKILRDKLDIKLGRLTTASEFAASPFACDFISLATCGHPRNVTQHGFASWPGASWGARVLYNIFSQAYVQLGVYESDPWPQGGRNGWDWAAQNATGVYIPIEYGYNPVLGKNRLTGYYRLGFAADSSHFPTWKSAINHSGKKSSHFQLWMILDQMIYRNDSEKDHGIYILANFGYSSPNANVSSVKTAYNIGFIDRGFWHARPNDQFGIMLTYYKVPHALTRAQQMQRNNSPIIYLNNAPAVQHNSIMVEGNYNFAICNVFTLTPVIQYFHNIAATRNIYKDAVILGMKTRVVF